MTDLFSLDSYEYQVPEHLIAKYPLPKRDSARLLLVSRQHETIEEAHVADLPSILHSSDLLVLNNTKVLHARLYGTLSNGRKIECLLSEWRGANCWLVVVKKASFLHIGTSILFSLGIVGTVQKIMPDGMREIVFSTELTPELLQAIGSVPLPPYIRRESENSFDSQRYQTVYAKTYGSVAAPTAGLHFTDDLFKRLHRASIETAFITLHVGSGTFLPIRTQNLADHRMHEEQYEICEETAQKLAAQPKKRVIAVGTTSLRCLESAYVSHKTWIPHTGKTNLFITPGYTFSVVEGLFTNFHTPKSSLLVLVSAFLGYAFTKEVYAEAIRREFRLFSYGDAMLII